MPFSPDPPSAPPSAPRLTIAFAVPGDLATVTGGYFYDRRLIESLRAMGHDVRVVTLSDGFPDPGAQAMRAAVEQLVSLSPEWPVIIDGLAFGALPTADVARIAAPIVALVHHPLAAETGLDPAEAARLRGRERDNLRLARHILVPSPHTRAILMAEYGVEAGRITVLLPGIDRVSSAGVEALGVPRTPPPLILSVGILHPRKGHDVLIDALGELGDLEWRAEIVGTPWDAAHVEELRRRVAASSVADRIRLAGRVEADARDRLYAEASVFALATRYEGYGIVFNEALAQGLPIVSCRTGAVSDTVPGAAGLLVPVGDVAGFAGALRLVLTDGGFRGRMAAAARRAGAALPGWDDTAARAAAVLARITG